MKDSDKISQANVKGHTPDPETARGAEDPPPNPPQETDTKRGAGCVRHLVLSILV